MKKIILSVITLILPSVAFCQPENNYQKSNKLFLQETMNFAPLGYVSPPWHDIGNPKTAYILSADMQPNFVIGGQGFPLAIHLTPRYKVRIFKDNIEAGDSSLPVRTPSFMPGGTVFYKPGLLRPDQKRFLYYSVSFFHHSNGQDGNEFNPNGSINTYNGNFSTNYIEPAVHYRFRKNNRNREAYRCSTEKVGYRDYYFRLGYEHHFFTAKDLKPTYGDYRLNLNFTYLRAKVYCLYGDSDAQRSESYYRERHRINFAATLIMGNRAGELNSLGKRINFNGNYNWRVPGSPNTSLFIGGGYYGSDTYNIYYQNSYWYAHAGLSFGFFVAPKMIDFLSEKNPNDVPQKHTRN